MNVAIIITKVTAAQNIKKNLGFSSYENMKVYCVDKESIYCDDLDKEIEADLFVIATRHQSSSGKASLTCHTQGNWGKAELGGKEKELGIAPALYLKEFYLALTEYRNGFEGEVTLEVTHHGPSLGKPCIFVEIGSGEKEWADERYGKIIADCIKKVFVKELSGESCVLIGGGHYNQAANKVMERTNYAVGHICPKYALQSLDPDMLRQAINKTVPKPHLVVLDWKGLGTEKERIVKMLDEMQLKYVKSKNLWS